MPTEATNPGDLAWLDRRVVCLLGLPFDVLGFADMLERLGAAVQTRQRLWLSTPNLNFLIAAHKDPEFRRTVLVSDYSVVDGMAVVWLARLAGLPLRERLAGSDLFEAMHDLKHTPPWGAYFFGGPDGAAEAACARVNARQAGLRCAGYQSPGFGSLESMSTHEVLEEINRAAPDVVVVSLGAKRGQFWIERNQGSLLAPVIGPLGAVVNFEAGTVRRAPHVWRRLGFEWLWRIRQEPALWRRYAADGLALLPLLWRHVLPFMWARPGRGRAHHALSTSVEVGADGAAVLSLDGACVWATVERLRDGCRQALALGRALRVDMAKVTELDADAMGVLLRVQGWQLRRGTSCAVHKASALARKRLIQHGCGDLLHAVRG